MFDMVDIDGGGTISLSALKTHLKIDDKSKFKVLKQNVKEFKEMFGGEITKQVF